MNRVDRHFLTQDRLQGAATFGFLVRFQGAAPSCEELQDLVAVRLAPLARLRCRFDGRRWVVRERLDPTEHVGIHATASESETAATLLGERLDPPWRLDLLTGYADGEFALLFRSHHALLDGVAASLILRHLLGEGEPHPDWSREPATVSQPATRAHLTGLLTALAERPGRGLPFNGPHGPGRHLAVVRVPRRLLDAARTRPETLNDVYLAAVAGAVRRMGRTQGPHFVMVPVDLRTAGTAHVLGNQLAMIRVRLPLNVSLPKGRLATVHARTARAKRLSQARGLALLTQATAAMGVAGQVALMRTIWMPLMSNIVCSNVPIPTEPLALAGRPVTDIVGATILQPPHGICMMLHGYGDTVTISVVSDAQRAQFADKFANELQQELHDLAL
ncbi:MAG: DUF1298 domain-containing protein [Thermoactinospora sp.]|nr:DUF1298 domain-containing protein [Thermoactinospora sp.]